MAAPSDGKGYGSLSVSDVDFGRRSERRKTIRCRLATAIGGGLFGQNKTGIVVFAVLANRHLERNMGELLKPGGSRLGLEPNPFVNSASIYSSTEDWKPGDVELHSVTISPASG